MSVGRRIAGCGLAVCLALALAPGLVAQPAKGRILIVLSSAHELPLKDGRTFETGYYLNELVVPARKFAAAGYELVFATPAGSAPVVDPASISAGYFGGSRAALEDAQRYQSGLTGLAHPLRLSDVAHGDLSQYRAVFVPGGPAPLADLMADPDLGAVLRDFHTHHRTTIFLCHAPIALLAALPGAPAVQAALRAGDLTQAKHLARDWPYRGYRMTVFSDEEEAVAAQSVFHGEPPFTPEEGLRLAGGKVETVKGWAPHAVADRELLTGQNPASDAQLADLALRALAAD